MLTDSQRRYLRGVAQTLKPVVILGQKGITPALVAEISHCLHDHELIKLKINAADRIQRDELVATVCQQAQAELVHRIGNRAALYRKNPKQEKIVLPA